MPEKFDAIITVHCPAELKAQVEEICNELMMSSSDFVRIAIKEKLERDRKEE